MGRTPVPTRGFGGLLCLTVAADATVTPPAWPDVVWLPVVWLPRALEPANRYTKNQKFKFMTDAHIGFPSIKLPEVLVKLLGNEVATVSDTEDVCFQCKLLVLRSSEEVTTLN